METLQVERDGGIVTVTLNRPEKRNAIDATMWDELARIWRASRQPAPPTTGAWSSPAPAATSAPAPTCGRRAPSGAPHPPARRSMRSVIKAHPGLHDLPQPTIAKVAGVAAGAALNLALGCDLVVRRTRGPLLDDLRQARPVPRRRRVLAAAPARRLHQAKELALFADILSAEEAADFGLVNRVVPDAELDALRRRLGRAASPPARPSRSA